MRFYKKTGERLSYLGKKDRASYAYAATRARAMASGREEH